MKAIMYHYVQEYNPKLPYLKFLDFNNFKKQLDYLKVIMVLYQRKNG